MDLTLETCSPEDFGGESIAQVPQRLEALSRYDFIAPRRPSDSVEVGRRDGSRLEVCEEMIERKGLVDRWFSAK